MAWKTSYYHFDAVGSTRLLTDADQNVRASYPQRAFGEQLTSDNAVVNPFRFIGQFGYYFDAANGLLNVRQRVYDANLGRWLSEDPVPDDHNLYRYVGNCPLQNTDPSGLANVWNIWTWDIRDPNSTWGHFLNPIADENLALWGTFLGGAYHSGEALVTGKAGRQIGERAVLIGEHQTGKRFIGTSEQWRGFAYSTAQEMSGANAAAEGAVGFDRAYEVKIEGWERGSRLSGGIGAMSGTAAIGFGFASGTGISNIGTRPIPGTPIVPTLPLPEFMRRPLIRRSGTLTAIEEQEIVAIVSKHDTTTRFGGSRAHGRGRNLNTDFPKGKLPKETTRSDIDFRIDTAHPNVSQLIRELETVNRSVGSASPKFRLQDPSWPPYFSVSPTGVIYVGPNVGAGGVIIGIGGNATQNER